MATCLLFSMKDMASTKVFSATMVSGFKIHKYSPLAWDTPILFPIGNPTFSLLAIRFTCGNLAFIQAKLPSTEALSTTIISASKSFVAAATLCKQISIKYFTL